MPSDAGGISYHYTDHAGLKGILKSGGLRATYRKTMNDPGEFSYARNLVLEALDGVGRSSDLAPVAQSLVKYSRLNLERHLDESTGAARSYCACLTVSPDHQGQWETYADKGKGFAIGFNMFDFFRAQSSRAEKGRPFIVLAPVTYDETKQRCLARKMIEAGIRDLQTFASRYSTHSGHLTALRDRVTRETVLHLLVLIDLMKAPMFSSEKEMRLIFSPNDGTLDAQEIHHYERDGLSIPYILMDLRRQDTKRLPLAEIMVGPSASFSGELRSIEELLDSLEYGHRNFEDRPRITHSRHA